MELQQTISAECHVSVTYRENGALSVKVFAQAPYNPLGAVATCEVEAHAGKVAQLRAILEDILREAQPRLGDGIARAIHVSREAATRLGEV